MCILCFRNNVEVFNVLEGMSHSVSLPVSLQACHAIDTHQWLLSEAVTNRCVCVLGWGGVRGGGRAYIRVYVSVWCLYEGHIYVVCVLGGGVECWCVCVYLSYHVCVVCGCVCVCMYICLSCVCVCVCVCMCLHQLLFPYSPCC